ncbi:MAG: DNA repair protein RecO [Alphaproteobacteria bacterium]
MKRWEDQAIVLAAKAHGENGAIVSLLTESQGRHAGYVHGATSARSRGSLEIGNIVDATWQSRVHDQLGTLTIELITNTAAHFMQDPLRLAALQSACAICDQAIPEREVNAGLFHGLKALLQTLDTDVWGPSYVMWEIALLRELGFSLDLSKCAWDGSNDNLAYVSPKTGRAVSEAAGKIYKERLLILPDFLKPNPSPDFASLNHPLPAGEGGEPQAIGVRGNPEDVLKGLKLTGHFLEHWVFTHHTQGVPEARLRFEERLRK